MQSLLNILILVTLAAGIGWLAYSIAAAAQASLTKSRERSLTKPKPIPKPILKTNFEWFTYYKQEELAARLAKEQYSELEDAMHAAKVEAGQAFTAERKAFNARTIAYYYEDDDSNLVNPSTGLPMVSDCFDAGGNLCITGGV